SSFNPPCADIADPRVLEPLRVFFCQPRQIHPARSIKSKQPPGFVLASAVFRTQQSLQLLCAAFPLFLVVVSKKRLLDQAKQFKLWGKAIYFLQDCRVVEMRDTETLALKFGGD